MNIQRIQVDISILYYVTVTKALWVETLDNDRMNLYLVQIKFENYFMIAYININTRSQRHSHKTECSIESQFNTIKLPEKQTIAKIYTFIHWIYLVLGMKGLELCEPTLYRYLDMLITALVLWIWKIELCSSLRIRLAIWHEA